MKLQAAHPAYKQRGREQIIARRRIAKEIYCCLPTTIFFAVHRGYSHFGKGHLARSRRSIFRDALYSKRPPPSAINAT